MNLEPRDILAILGAIAGLGGAFAYFRGNAAKATIEVLEKNNGALTERIKILEDEKAQQMAQLHDLQGQVKVLKDMVTGTSAIQALGEQITKAFSESHADHAKIVTVLETISNHFAPTAIPAPGLTRKVRSPKLRKGGP